MMNEDLNQTAVPLKVIPELSSKPLPDDSPSREAWKFPLLAEFKNWVIGFGGALLVVVLLVLGVAWYLYKTQPVPVDATKPAIAVVAPPTVAPQAKPNAKTDAKKKAEQATNTPPRVEFVPEFIPQIAPLVEAAIALQPKPQPATRGPERPLPPLPPFPPLPHN